MTRSLLSHYTGRLGHGDEDDVCEPQEVILPMKYKIVLVHAGSDCTFLLTDKGRVLACGSNEYNKLGLNSEVRGVAKRKAKVSSEDLTVRCRRVITYFLDYLTLNTKFSKI